MKKQINPTIKAHLIRGAFYLLLLLAVCAIPFTLAQRNTTRRAVTKPKVAANAKLAAATSRLPYDVPARPKAKSVVTPSHQFSHASGTTRSKQAPTGAACWYDFTVGTDTFVPGVTDLGFDCDDCGADVALPFPVTLYGQSYATAHVGSNGYCTFGTFNDSFNITCTPFGIRCTTDALAPYWTDQTVFAADGHGVFTTTTGSSPNRIFYIEWRSEYYGSPHDSLNYEIALFENGTPAFEYIYNTISTASLGNDSELVVGQKHDATCFALFGCDPSGGGSPPVSSGQALIAVAAPTPTLTLTPACSPIVVNGVIDSSGGGGPCTLGPWNVVAPYALISESVSVSSDGTFAYAVGGLDGANHVPTNSFNVYDPIGDTWSPLPNIPGAFYDAPSVYVPGTNSIYVFGGLDAGFNPSNVVQIYDITSGTWTTGAPMPGPRNWSGAVYYSGNGLVYVAGGFDEHLFETTTTWEYDPVANTWNTSRAPMPVAMAGMGYSIVGQNMYLAGTWNGGFGSTLHYRYDIVADAWTQMANVPVNIYRPAAASIGTNTYLVGGGDPFVAPRASPKARKLASTRAPALSFNTTYVYDTLADTWSIGPYTNVARSFTGGTAIGNSLIVVTGFDGGGDTNTVEKADCGGGTPTPTPGGSCPPVITQSTSTKIELDDSVACQNRGETRENHYWRAFDMGTFTGGQEYDVTSVDMGVELAISFGVQNSVTVNIYANHGAPFPGGDWQSNLVGTSGPINIPDLERTFPVNIPITATVAAGTLELVLEVMTADGHCLGNYFFIGANSATQTGLSYASAADCGITVPTPTGDIGFPNTHWVFNVNGSCPAGTPTPTATATATTTATPTATVTATATATATASVTASPTATAAETPRSTPTPRPRPTPAPRP